VDEGEHRAVRFFALAAVGAALLSALGCAYTGEAKDFDPGELTTSPGWISVPEVPLEIQKSTEDCGTTALSMVLEYWRVAVSLEEWESSGLLLAGKGSRARDLRDLARQKGLQAFLIHGRWEDLRNEVDRGHPVIVGLVKPASSGAVTHYEVVVAVHPEREIVVTHDPANGRRQYPLSGFRKEWDPAGYLTLVFFRGEVRGANP
jgi:ABC-type bacteriocin/lantibiotic exporter with double-glycine peptidase domain